MKRPTIHGGLAIYPTKKADAPARAPTPSFSRDHKRLAEINNPALSVCDFDFPESNLGYDNRSRIFLVLSIPPPSARNTNDIGYPRPV